MPIIFLSSYDADLDKVSGFRLGADDYISKDVTFDFLAIRIDALFRRIDSYRLPMPDAPAPPIDAVGDEPAGLRFDSRTSTVEPNTVSAHVKAIRKAFLEVDPAFDRIHTERGRGYRWLGF